MLFSHGVWSFPTDGAQPRAAPVVQMTAVKCCLLVFAELSDRSLYRSAAKLPVLPRQRLSLKDSSSNLRWGESTLKLTETFVT